MYIRCAIIASNYAYFVKKKKTKLAAFRLSEDARKTLRAAAQRTGMTQTKILELSIIKNAMSIEEMAESEKLRWRNWLAQQTGEDKKKK